LSPLLPILASDEKASIGGEEGWPGVFPGDGDGAVEGGEDELSDGFGDEEEMDVAAIRRGHGRSKDGRRGGGERRSKDIFKDLDREREVGHVRQRWDGSGSGRWSRLERIGRMDQTVDVEEMAIRLASRGTISCASDSFLPITVLAILVILLSDAFPIIRLDS
jgi:hypothetical protein